MRKKINAMFKTGFIAVLCAGMVFASACGQSASSTAGTTDTSTTAATKEAESDADAESFADDINQAVAGVNQLRELQPGDTVAELEIAGYGKVTILLFPEQAPLAVENFVGLAEQGYYDGLTFHRVIEDFMLQGGDPTGTGRGGESFFGKSFEDEFSADLFPLYGSLCMANSGKNTNGSQFFLVTCKDVVSYAQLEQVAQSYASNYGINIDYSMMSKQCRNNYASVGGAYWLYCQHTVFGQIVEGLDIIDKADSAETDSNDKPVADIIVEKVTIRTV